MLPHTRSLPLVLSLTHDTKTRLFLQAFRPGDFRLATGNSLCQLTEMKLPVSPSPPSLPLSTLSPVWHSPWGAGSDCNCSWNQRRLRALWITNVPTVIIPTTPTRPYWGKCANLECERKFALKCLPNLVGQHLKHDLTKSRTGSPGLPAYPFTYTLSLTLSLSLEPLLVLPLPLTQPLPVLWRDC